MKRTALQALITIKDPEFRTFVFNNLDERFLNKDVHTLSMALTFAVHTHGVRENWLRIEEYIKSLKNGNETPLYEHKCDKCLYLGSFSGSDLYFHAGEKNTIVSNNEKGSSDYYTALHEGEQNKNDMDSILGEAYHRSIIAHLLN